MPEDKNLNQPEDQTHLEEEPNKLRARVSELEGLIIQKDQGLTLKDSHISELLEALASKENEVTDLKQSLFEFNNTISQLKETLKETVESYKAQAVTTNPDIPGELISGDSIEEVNVSLESAKELVSKVRKGIEAEISLARFPAGAPERTAPDLSVLSPREKIQYAIGGRR